MLVRLPTLRRKRNSAGSNSTEWLISTQMLSYPSCTCTTNTNGYLQNHMLINVSVTN